MSKKKSLQDVLEDELKDLFSAENQLLKALPKMAKAATSETLKEALENHLEETQEQIVRLQQIADELEIKLSGKTCKAMKGLIEEGKEVMEEDVENPALLDAMLIGAAQRVEHYEIAAYGTARAMAEKLGLTEVVNLLQETLDEEGAADQKLTDIAESEVLDEATQEEGESEGEEDEEAIPVSMKGKKGSSTKEVRR